MCLARQVYGWRCRKLPQPILAVVRKRPSQRHSNCREIRLRFAIREIREGTGRQAEFSHQPVQCVPFDFVRPRRSTPRGELRVVRRHQRVRHNGGRRHTWIEETKVTRVSNLHLPRP